VSEMYRRDWRAYSNNNLLKVDKIFGGLISIRLPPNANEIQLRYVPTLLYGSIGASYLMVILALFGIGFSMRGRDR